MRINVWKIFIYVCLIIFFTLLGNYVIHVNIKEEIPGEPTKPPIIVPHVPKVLIQGEKKEHVKPIVVNPPLTEIGVEKSNLKFPNLKNTYILIITWARTTYLEKTLDSIMKQPNIHELAGLLISQDGVEPYMIKFLDSYFKDKGSLFKKIDRFHSETRGLQSEKIAQNYRFGLRTAFEKHGADKVIIIEDDLVLSPDFFAYMNHAMPLLDDPSVWCISSWNDFAYPHLVDPDPKRIFRTQYFPGLGWALNRKIWDELSVHWTASTNLWDENLMRVDSISKNRDCIVPEVSRNYNIGAFGANMKEHEYNQKLKNTVWSQETKVAYEPIENLYLAEYDERMRSLVASATVINSVNQVVGVGNVYLILYNIKSRLEHLQSLQIPFKEMRTHHENTLVVKYNKNTLILANERLSPFLSDSQKVKSSPTLQIVDGFRSQSCEAVCLAKSKKCDQDHFDYINNCASLAKYFPCKKCEIQFGPDLPNIVEETGKCLITQAWVPTCEGRHETTTRLCPCV